MNLYHFLVSGSCLSCVLHYCVLPIITEQTRSSIEIPIMNTVIVLTDTGRQQYYFAVFYYHLIDKFDVNQIEMDFCDCINSSLCV